MMFSFPLVQIEAERVAAFVPLAEAIGDHLTRAQRDDAELGYLVGPGTETFRLLCLAEAAATGRPVAEVEAVRGRDLVPDHHLRPRRLEEAEKRIELLEEHVSERHLSDVDDDLEAWGAAWLERARARRAGVR